ncbi:uncharacterized protein LY79DRAFT_61894 [Colletotrichum navitas]|uniref:Uncharacterized protein n=1 Tax=Colletotrichum navitas TaxID=681940 RepID=A0AAD8Q5N3_9PEZI|nr:uncharacterized protein LY79DRAFT_61894 [Colletotrichum navitas]KAK1596341.1 hypothetical protein LY79DRAFT_61894 [Colletotrichum navitas]
MLKVGDADKDLLVLDRLLLALFISIYHRQERHLRTLGWMGRRHLGALVAIEPSGSSRIRGFALHCDWTWGSSRNCQETRACRQLRAGKRLVNSCQSHLHAIGRGAVSQRWVGSRQVSCIFCSLDIAPTALVSILSMDRHRVLGAFLFLARHLAFLPLDADPDANPDSTRKS